MKDIFFLDIYVILRPFSLDRFSYLGYGISKRYYRKHNVQVFSFFSDVLKHRLSYTDTETIHLKQRPNRGCL